MPLAIRPLSESDLDSADALLRSAFCIAYSRVADVKLHRAVEPQGIWLALRDGQPVGMVGAVNYAAVAHVGFMAVLEAAQRQGIGWALMRHLLDTLERQGVPLVTLDASDAGRPMYLKLGFTDEDTTQTFSGAPGPAVDCPPQIQPVTPGNLEALAQWDCAVFGADRSRALRALLAAFPGRACLLRDAEGQIAGYVFAQGKRIGPWVARRALEAEVLLRAALSRPFAGAVSVVAPGLNPDVGPLLRRYGFELEATSHAHMFKGAPVWPSQRRLIYGQASLFLG
jgi:predicted N-acetyltransferase YhbS